MKEHSSTQEVDEASTKVGFLAYFVAGCYLFYLMCIQVEHWLAHLPTKQVATCTDMARANEDSCAPRVVRKLHFTPPSSPLAVRAHPCYNNKM